MTGNMTGQRSSASSWPAGTQSPALSLQQEGLRLQRNQKQHKDRTELSFPGLPGSFIFIWVPCWVPSLLTLPLSTLRHLITSIPTRAAPIAEVPPHFHPYDSHLSTHIHMQSTSNMDSHPTVHKRSGCLLTEKWGETPRILLTVQMGAFLPPASNNSLHTKVNSLGYAQGIERSKFTQPVRTQDSRTNPFPFLTHYSLSAPASVSSYSGLISHWRSWFRDAHSLTTQVTGHSALRSWRGHGGVFR